MRHNWMPKGAAKQKCENCGMKLETKKGARGGTRSHFNGEAYDPRKGTPPCKAKNPLVRKKLSPRARR